jgi:hypothetical protein
MSEKETTMHIRSLVLATVAALAFSSAALAGGLCKEADIAAVPGTPAFNSYSGNNGGTRPVFYGDIGCGPAGTCVMPSISDFGSTSVTPVAAVPGTPGYDGKQYLNVVASFFAGEKIYFPVQPGSC